MSATIQKNHIKIKGKSIPIDLFFLDALSLTYFGKPYKEAMRESNTMVRDLVKEERELHPQLVERYIVSSLLTKKLKKELGKVDIYKPLCYN